MSLNHFTPVSGLIGGSLIGLSAATLLLFNGNILGASGLAASLVVTPRKTLTEDSQHWKLSFIAAFALTTRLYVSYIDPDALKDARLANDLNATVVSPMGFVIGGFLVGFGTRLGNGCTTGHGICGLARLSVRSLSGVLAFMATGMFSATGCSPTCPFNKYLRASVETVKNYFPTETTKNIGTILASLAAGVALPGFLRKAPESASKSERDEYDSNRSKIITSVVSGALFSVGLVISKMTLASKIYGFLDVKGIKGGYWDPTLVCVMGGGLVVSFLSYQWVKGFNVFQNSKALECPLSQKKSVGHFDVPTNQVIDFNLIFGEALFGLGWGAAGLCPGPAMFLAFAGYPNVLLRWWPSFFVGSLLAEQLKNAQLRLEKNKKID